MPSEVLLSPENSGDFEQHDLNEHHGEVTNSGSSEVQDQESGAEFERRLQVERRERHFVGPIPSPEILSEYNALEPTLVNRIVKMAELEQKHRHSCEREVLNMPKRGQRYALALCTTIVVGSFILMYFDKPVLGAVVFFGTSIGGLAYIFITGNKSSENTSASDSD